MSVPLKRRKLLGFGVATCVLCSVPSLLPVRDAGFFSQIPFVCRYAFITKGMCAADAKFLMRGLYVDGNSRQIDANGDGRLIFLHSPKHWLYNMDAVLITFRDGKVIEKNIIFD